jgi:hypothetical protein
MKDVCVELWPTIGMKERAVWLVFTRGQSLPLPAS